MWDSILESPHCEEKVRSFYLYVAVKWSSCITASLCNCFNSKNQKRCPGKQVLLCLKWGSCFTRPFTHMCLWEKDRASCNVWVRSTGSWGQTMDIHPLQDQPDLELVTHVLIFTIETVISRYLTDLKITRGEFGSWLMLIKPGATLFLTIFVFFLQ